MAELQHGLVPREFESSDRLTPQAQRIYATAMQLASLLNSVEGIWPTPVVLDSTSTANLTAGRSDPNSQHHSGTTMTDAIRLWSEGIWPTPYGMANVDASGKLGLGGEMAKMVTQWAEGEWPTPATRDWRSGEASPEMYVRNARPLNEMVIAWFEHLTELLDEGTWATPSAAVVNDGEGVSTWRARQESLKQKGYNGNGAGVPLTIQVQEQCLSSHPDLEAFVGWLSRITGLTSSPPSPPKDGSPSPVPSTRSSSRGNALVRLNPAFVAWLMGGIEMVDRGHTCRTATAPAPICCEGMATA